MDRCECREEVKENIEYQRLAEQYGHKDADEILDLITDTLCSIRPTIRIGGEEIPIEAVKDRFWRLEQSHIEYVFDRMKENTTKIRNIRGYLLTPCIMPLLPSGITFRPRSSMTYMGSKTSRYRR